MRLKVSYSVLNMWLQGRQSQAIEALNGVWMPPTPAMLFGTKMHKQWEQEVKETGNFPAVFGGGVIPEPPETELYKKVQLLDWLWLSGIVDLKYGHTIVDYKTGKGTANSYLSSLQHGAYKVLFPEAKIFRYLCWNQYTNKVTSSQALLSDTVFDRSLDEIITLACDIRATLEQLGMEGFDNVDSKKRQG